jgi:hypothetical protein
MLNISAPTLSSYLESKIQKIFNFSSFCETQETGT